MTELPTDQPAASPLSRRRLLAQATVAGTAVMFTGCQTPGPHRAEAEAAPAKIVARCGYRCDLCAARSDDPAVRQKLVDAWRKYYGHTRYTAENVHCGGCGSEKRADMTCRVRPCVIAKGIENCAQCGQCPCDKLRPLCSSPHFNFVRYGDVPQTDYDLALRQFDNVPELMQIRAAGRRQQ